MPIPELKLIERIRRMAGILAPAPGKPVVVRGIGDDCAVLRLGAGSDTLVTTDLSIEGVHFRRDWYPAGFIGRQCLTRGLSDVAAMGGEPVAFFLSLALPPKTSQTWVDAFFRGMLAHALEFNVALSGGDISTSTSGVVADIMVIGRVPAGKAVLRSGAKPGDGLYVTGMLGVAAARVAALRAGKKVEVASAQPTPRVRVGRRLIGVASAMIDTSDGLSTDLKHLCDESGVGAIVYAPALPAPAGLDFALHGGEDYELLFTAPARKKVPSKIAGVPISRIGEITRGFARKDKPIWLADPRGRMHRLKPQGWQHFSG
ncbi:MAG: thiamine-phosphate kinase [Candidatus Koribacter versatilis]|uniref:Thiamine-monophosphate kinase n=1 Tax=Candidatus Korobacter versatilis TaxID=658062 RepID=A0A932A782_9BACT|nr:thiamine-phosphate kinase [Candidatus Koribacter versatilis]